MSSDLSDDNSRASEDTPFDLLLDDKDVTCPICKDVFVFPRTYECGHTICELCMYEMDRRDCSQDTHTAVVHHCPVCRAVTLQSWHNRPISILLEKICSNHPGYDKRREEVLEQRSNREGSMTYIPEDIDLADASHAARIKLAFALYEIILERLYKASLRGLSHLIIKEKTIVSDIEKVVDLLSIQLFTKHNIYKILVTRGECTVYIHKDAFQWRRNYENDAWVDPSGENETSSSPIVPRRRDPQFSSVLSSLLSNDTIPPPPPVGSLARHRR